MILNGILILLVHDWLQDGSDFTLVNFHTLTLVDEEDEITVPVAERLNQFFQLEVHYLVSC